MSNPADPTPEPDQPNSTPAVPISLEELLSRHRKELRDLQSRVTQKKKNATKKSRRGINSECESLERELKARHEREIWELTRGDEGEEENKEGEQDPIPDDSQKNSLDGKIEFQNHSSVQSTPSQPSSSSQPPSQPQKKPNRAKARLAKRAAELESLSKQAAEEATSIPDLKTSEQSLIRLRIQGLKLEEKEIPPDGHCLYSALADQLEWLGITLEIPTSELSSSSSSSSPSSSPSSLSAGNNNNNDNIATTKTGRKPYSIIRTVCARYIERHPDDFAPFLEEDLSSHVHKIANTAEWGGHVEILAVAKAYDVVVNVVQAEGRIERMNEGETDKKDRKEVWLAFYRHSFGLGEHYNSLRRRRE